MNDADDVSLTMCDTFAKGLVQNYLGQESLAIVLRMDGSHLGMIMPSGKEALLARLLYRAADEMVDRIPLPNPKDA